MKNLAILAGLIAASLGASAQTIIYDTFNEDDQSNLFDCCNVLAVSGKHSDAHARAAAAVPFVPVADARITEVDIALSSSVDIPLKVYVYGSTMGLPGRAKHEFVVHGIAAGGQCCEFYAETATGVPVKAGGKYWIAVKSYPASNGGWNLNSIGASGPYAVLGASGPWTPADGTLAAVRVIGQ